MSLRSQNKGNAAQSKLHVRAIGPHPQYPTRFPLKPEQVPWSAKLDNYEPIYYEDHEVLNADSSFETGAQWADPIHWTYWPVHFTNEVIRFLPQDQQQRIDAISDRQMRDVFPVRDCEAGENPISFMGDGHHPFLSSAITSEAIRRFQDGLPFVASDKDVYEGFKSGAFRFSYETGCVDCFTHTTQEVRHCVLNGDPRERPRMFKTIQSDEVTSQPEKCTIRIPLGGLPKNPVGRTGMVGRGLLGKFGPNHAADPIVTRTRLRSGGGDPVVEVILIERQDTGELALPGGMVDAGEIAVPRVVTALRELFEEAYAHEPGSMQARGHDALKQAFKREAVCVYRGYVDDPRNTDVAWMETACYHLHIDATRNNSTTSGTKLKAGDDAKKARWVEITPSLPNLYADHASFIWRAIALRPHLFPELVASYTKTIMA